MNWCYRVDCFKYKKMHFTPQECLRNANLQRADHVTYLPSASPHFRTEDPGPKVGLPLSDGSLGKAAFPAPVFKVDCGLVSVDVRVF